MTFFHRSILALLLLAAFAVPAFAGDLALQLPVASGYGDGFVEYWKGTFKKQNNIVLFILLFGAFCITILVYSVKNKNKG